MAKRKNEQQQQNVGRTLQLHNNIHVHGILGNTHIERTQSHTNTHTHRVL